MGSLHLSADDGRRLRAATEALLSPLAGPSPEQWWGGVHDAVSDLLGGANVMLVTPDPATGRLRYDSASVDGAARQRLTALTAADADSGRMRAMDPLIEAWFQRRRSQRVEVWNEAYNDRMLDHRLGESVIYHEGLLAGGLHDFSGLTSECASGELILMMGYDGRGQARFEPECELELLRLLLPALRAGHHAVATFGSRRTALAGMLDAVPDALLVVGAGGREWHRNAALRRLLADEPERERVLACMHDAAGALEALRLAAGGRAPTGTGRGRLAEAPDATRSLATAVRRYTVRGAFACEHVWGAAGTVLVSLEAEAAGAVLADGGVPDALRARGITAREAEVMRLLAQRLTNDEIAAALGVSKHTARHHTERVMQKLGVRSRRALPAAVHEAITS